MKRIIRNSILSLTAILYVFSYAGVGIHSCNIEKTRDLVLLLGDISCETIHDEYHEHGHHHHSESRRCGHCHNFDGTLHFHTAECCDTNIYSITDSQDATDPYHIHPSDSPTGVICFQEVESVILKQHLLAFAQSTGQHPPRDKASNALLSVWRL